MKTPHISKRIWMAISTAAVIGILFVFYLMIYIPERERELNNKKFRTLQQAGENFFNRKKAYEISIDQALDEYNKKFYDCSGKGDYLDFFVYEKCRNRADSILEKRLKPIRSDVYTPFMGATESDSLLNLRISRAEDLIFPGTRFKKKTNSYNSAYQGYEEYYTSAAKYYNFSVSISQLVTSSAGMINNHFNKFMLIRVFNVRSKKVEPKPGQALFISSDDLLPSADENDELKEGDELKKDSVVAVIAFQGMGNIDRPGSENKIVLGDLKKLFQGDALSSIPVQTVRVSGIPHRLFAHVVQHRTDEDWILCGMVEESVFNRDVKSVSLLMIVFLSLSLLFVLLAMPILKLLIMSAIERPQITNVWFTGFCIVIGTTVIFLILLTSSQFVGYERVYNDNLQKVSDSILSHFNNEIISVVRQLRRSDSIKSEILRHKRRNLEFIQAGHLLRSQKDYFERDFGRMLNKTASVFTSDYPYFNETMWTNDQGNQIIRLANHGVNERISALNIGHRNYFKNALNKKLYPLYENGNQVDEFCLESIYSWYNLTNEAGVSVRTSGEGRHNLKVLSMATKLHSVMDVLLPPGYEYCIISPDGRVLFHHDKNKNLQENFFLEIDHERIVRAAIASRHPLCKSITYNGKNYQANITPITHQELFLVTLFDRDYYKTPVVLTFGFSFVLVMILFFVQGIQVVLLFVTTYKFTKLRINRFFLSWLRPRIDSYKGGKKENPKINPSIVSFKEAYVRVIAAMILITALLVYIISGNMERHLILPFITLPVILLTFHYAVFHGNVCRLTPGKFLRKKFVIASIILLTLVNLAAFQYFSSQANLMLVLLQGAIILTFFFFLFAPFPKRYFQAIPISYHGLYITFICFWLVLVSVLPVSYFYKVSFDREMSVWTRYVQWKAFQDEQKRMAQVDLDLEKLDFFDTKSPDYPVQRSRYIAHMNRFGNYLHADGTFVCLKDSATNNYKKFDHLAIDPLEFDLRPVYFGPMEDSRLGLTTHARDLWWEWKNSSNSVLINVDTRLGDFKYASPILPYRIFNGPYGPFLIVLLLIVLLLICRIIIIVVRKIFGMHLIETCQPLPVTFEKLQEMVEQNHGTCHRLFLVGLPFSGKSNLLKKMKDQWKDQAEVVSLRSGIAEVELKGKKVFIIIHFEHGINDHATNLQKSELLQKLLATPDTTIIISSAIQPSIIIDVYERKIERINAEKRTDENRLEIQKELIDLRNAYRIWKNLLSDFEILYHPLEHDGRQRAIDGELNYGTYLPKLAVHFKDKMTKRLTEDTILEIEEKAELYYH